MLNDSQMSKLAEMCGWADYPTDGRAYADYRRLTQGPMAYTAFDKDNWQLTLAGYFVVIEKLGFAVGTDPLGKRHVIGKNICTDGFDTLPAAIDAALSEIL